MNILFTSVGRRYSLIESFKRELKQLSPSGRIIATDLKNNAPALALADKTYLVPRVSDPSYMGKLKEIIQQEKIQLIIPLIDTELCLLADHKDELKTLGATLLSSGPEVNAIAYDKVNTDKFFQANNIPAPEKIESPQNLAEKDYPVFLKPAKGSCSIGATIVHNALEMDHFLKVTDQPIVQKLMRGREFTIDALVLDQKKVICIVPRERLETRAGEVSKGKTVEHTGIIQATEDFIQKLPDPFGLLTIQCFLTEQGEVKFIEINPRFGGGAPLSIKAGANFPNWIIRYMQGEEIQPQADSWKRNFLMLRYDEAVYLDESELPQ